MSNYYLLKVTEEDNQILEIYENETIAKFCGNMYYNKEALKGNKISFEVIQLETQKRLKDFSGIY